MHTLVKTLVAILLLPLSAGAATNMIVEIIPFVVADNAYGSGAIYAHAIRGGTAYCHLTLSAGAQITRVDNISSSNQQTTTLLSTTDWLMRASNTYMAAFFGFDVYSNFVEFGDTFTDEIWRLGRDDGQLSLYVSEAVISNYTGYDSVQWLAPYCVNPANGEVAFYEGQSDQILVTTGPGAVTTLVSKAELENIFGNSSVSGGMTYDAAGAFYWGNNTIDALCGLETNGIVKVVLSQIQITSVTGESAVHLGEIYLAPDGWIYFGARGADEYDILRFRPENPALTLEMYITQEEIKNSVAGSANVVTMSTYNHALTWHQFGRNGIYVGYRDLVYSALSVTGETALTEFSSNVPYACSLVLTNAGGSVVPVDCTTSATWSIIGDVPPNTTLDGNLLTVGEATNLPVTIQALYAFDGVTRSNRLEVWVIPEPFAASLPTLALVLPFHGRRRGAHACGVR
jgi:hypothetical protein